MRDHVIDQHDLTDSYTEFVGLMEPRLRHALCAAFGSDRGREATAEALAYGWEHWSRVREMDNPAGYLWGVGRNHARRMRRIPVVLPPVPTGEMPWVEPSLAPALARLSEKQRLAVMLIHGLGWTHTEVAELLGVSKGTVQTHAKRGLAKLRRRVGGNDAD